MKSDLRFLRVRDVAELLGLSPTRTYQLAREGGIPSIRRGRSVRIPVGAFEQWMASREREALAAVRDGGQHEPA